MSTGATLNRHGSKQDYETPTDFILAVEERFGKITFDLAASPENTKANLFFTKEANSLSLRWEHRGISWLNPPFDNIAPWASKCADEGSRGAKILFLTPASIGANWFSNYVHRKAIVLALNGRLTFVGETTPYPKDCILSCYGFGQAEFDVWRWK